MWLMLPAYVPNPFAAVFGGGTPIDFGKELRDGRRILGDGKTYRGIFAGTVCGLIMGTIQMQIASRGFVISGTLLPTFGTGGMGSMIIIGSLAFGSLFGDMFMSFFKRRIGLKRGAALPLVDQLDFVLGAWVVTYLTSPEWFTSNFTTPVIIAVLVITPVLHLVTNVIGYLAGIKKEPW